MKRIISVLSVLAVVFSLCSCSNGSNATVSQTTTETSVPVTTETIGNKIKANGFAPELLPEFFVSELPDGINCISESYFPNGDDELGYESEFVHLRLKGEQGTFLALGNELKSHGWFGGADVVEPDESDEQANSQIVLFYRLGNYVCAVTSCDYSENIYTVSLDVCKCKSGLPAEVRLHFPDFEAYSLGHSFSVYDSDNKKTDDYENIDNYKWRCDFTGTDVFAGVSFEELDAYVLSLEKAGFELTQSDNENSLGNYCIVTGKKTVNGKDYCVQLTYFEYFNAVSAIFANDEQYFN